jgi:NADH-quinone oxidoreductase subunit N
MLKHFKNIKRSRKKAVYKKENTQIKGFSVFVYFITNPIESIIRLLTFVKKLRHKILFNIIDVILSDKERAETRYVETNRSSKATLFETLLSYRFNIKGQEIIQYDHAVINKWKLLYANGKSILFNNLSKLWFYNSKTYIYRWFFLFFIWLAFYSLQFAHESSFLNFICSYKNPIFYFIISFLYEFIFFTQHIWYIPFIWIIIWLFSLFLQWCLDLSRPSDWLNTHTRNAGETALINLSHAQIVEFSIFLLSFTILLLNVKNSVINFDFSDQTPSQIFHFNTIKPYTLSIIIFILYSCFLFFVSQTRKQNFKIWRMSRITALFITLFVTMLIILHTSHLTLIIMCLETFALILLYLMLFNLENLSNKTMLKAVLQFFMAQALASLLYIYGMSWLSVEYITLTSISATRIALNASFDVNQAYWCIIGFTYLILGLIMKMGIGPMGFWIFSVIRQLNFQTICVYFTFIKLIYFLTLISILQQFLGYHWENGTFFYVDWKFIFIFIGMGILSSIIGVIGLCVTDNIKNFLAYSSFINYGLILPTLYFGGNVNLSYGFAIPYILLYSLTTLTFIWLLSNYSFLNSDIITSLQNLFKKSKIITITHIILLSSLAGLPPFGGFFIKYFILRELFLKMPIISIILIILSVLAGLGYARIIINTLMTNSTHKTTFSKNDGEYVLLNDFISKISFIFISLTICTILLFSVILYYYNSALCNISFGFSNQFLMETSSTIISQRDWIPIYTEISKIDIITQDHKMWNYIEILNKTSKKLEIYLNE